MGSEISAAGTNSKVSTGTLPTYNRLALADGLTFEDRSLRIDIASDEVRFQIGQSGGRFTEQGTARIALNQIVANGGEIPNVKTPEGKLFVQALQLLKIQQKFLKAVGQPLTVGDITQLGRAPTRQDLVPLSLPVLSPERQALDAAKTPLPILDMFRR